MLITFNCPKCETKLEIESTAAGTSVDCPNCSSSIVIPEKGPEPGTTIGGFRLKKLLGSGGMGEVYLARQLSMDRDVALKILQSRLTFRKDLVDRFLHEVHLQARLEHPNIVTAYEAGADSGIYYMAMAYVKGEPLDILLAREGYMPEKKALQMVEKVARALAYAWDEHKLLHRDIKPGNIMVDRHGEPHLLDLGLSKSLDDAAGLTATAMLIGTPNYMSPEQAEGKLEVDSHADMYSLGATLYHMVSGQMPFQGSTVMETIRKQVSEPLPDPREFNPDISDACVALMEIMLAKDPAKRHESWEALAADVKRVLTGDPPTRAPLAEGESALLRLSDMDAAKGTKHRTIILKHSDARKLHDRGATRENAGSSWRKHLVVAAAIVFVGLLFVGRSRKNEQAPAVPAAEPAPAAVEIALTPEPAPEPTQAVSEPMPASSPAPEPPPLMPRADRPSPDGIRADDRRPPPTRERFDPREEHAIRQVMDGLRQQVDPLLAEHNPEAAIRLLMEYDGPLAEETADRRRHFADRIGEKAGRAEAHESADRAQTQGAFEALVNDIAGLMMQDDFAQVRRRLAEADTDHALAPARRDLDILKATIDEVARMPEIILQSFRYEVGREVPITFLNGRQELQVVSVGAADVKARKRLETAGFAERRFGVADLGTLEKLKRLGNEQTRELDLMRGLLLHRAGKTLAARKYFQRAGPPLGEALAARIVDTMAQAREAEAQKALASLLAAAQFPPDLPPDEEGVARIRRKAYGETEAQRIRHGTERFLAVHGQSATAEAHAPLLTALAGVDTQPREVDTALIEQALRALEQANPKASGIASIYEMGPQGLELNLSKNPELTNIAPLQGLPISRLNLGETGVSDLRPLRGLRLRALDLSQAPIEDLRALEMMPLKELYLAKCGIRDISALKDMPLEILHLAGNKVESITALRGMPLKWLDLGECPVKDLLPLKGMPLERLSIVLTPIQDLRPIRELPLKTLHVDATPIRDLKPLRGMPLEKLTMSWCQGVEDLEPLAGMPLKTLHCVNTRVSSLEPLRGMPLENLVIAQCSRIADISPLAGMPLKVLEMRETPVTDFSTITNMTILERLDLARAVYGPYRANSLRALHGGDSAGAVAFAQQFLDAYGRIPAFGPQAAEARQFIDGGVLTMAALFQLFRDQPGTIPDGARAFQGRHYFLHPLPMTWTEAQKFCEGQRAHLATINSKAEHDSVMTTFPGVEYMWLGGTAKKEGSWQWVTGEPWSYQNWGKNQPDNFNGVEKYLCTMPDGTWNDAGNEWPMPFLIEWDR